MFCLVFSVKVLSCLHQPSRTIRMLSVDEVNILLKEHYLSSNQLFNVNVLWVSSNCSINVTMPCYSVLVSCILVLQYPSFILSKCNIISSYIKKLISLMSLSSQCPIMQHILTFTARLRFCLKGGNVIRILWFNIWQAFFIDVFQCSVQ